MICYINFVSFFLGLQSLVFLRNFLSVKEHGKIDLLLYFGLRGWVLFLFTRIDLTDYSLLPNGLVFMSNIYSYFVLSIGLKITLLLSLRTARNKFVQ